MSYEVSEDLRIRHYFREIGKLASAANTTKVFAGEILQETDIQIPGYKIYHRGGESGTLAFVALNPEQEKFLVPIQSE